MPKHYKEMMDEIINKMDEDAPANAVAHGGVDMAPNAGKKKKKDEVPDELKKLNNISITGPISADIAFSPNKRCHYDLAVCMYHDQALIPIKTLDFYNGVNVTLGLDFIRTSPDHGTAFDIAGKNLANPESLISAINLAYEMGINKNNV